MQYLILSCLGSIYSGQRGARAFPWLLHVQNWCLEIFFVSWSRSKGKSWIKFFQSRGLIAALLPLAGSLLCSKNKFVEWGVYSHIVTLYWRKEIEILDYRIPDSRIPWKRFAELTCLGQAVGPPPWTWGWRSPASAGPRAWSSGCGFGGPIENCTA